jgi:hypothetical protein
MPYLFDVENNLSKLQFNFAHFLGPILTLRGPAPLNLQRVCAQTNSSRRVTLKESKQGTLIYIINHLISRIQHMKRSYLIQTGVTADVTGRQGMLTPPRHLIPPLVYPEVRVCPIL